uniref:TetR family transcriptional regulator C-terminal domain-containing protein n=1 Tax=Flavobacterium sp. TaxID=239 RepID=UPI00404A5121
MAVTKKSTAKKKVTDDNEIISIYMDYVLSNDMEPKNVFLFCKENNIEESDFYVHFGSIEAIKNDIWTKFFQNAKNTLEQDENYVTYTNRNKLLSLYFTLFEIFTLNRSYVLFTLKHEKDSLKHLKQLKEFRNHFKHFIVDNLESSASEQDAKIQKFTRPLFSEGSWVQFLFILKFWMDDTSKGFEKTDIMIEKSVKATFDLMDTTPLESLFDLGKFVWKERFN